MIYKSLGVKVTCVCTVCSLVRDHKAIVGFRQCSTVKLSSFITFCYLLHGFQLPQHQLRVIIIPLLLLFSPFPCFPFSFKSRVWSDELTSLAANTFMQLSYTILSLLHENAFNQSINQSIHL